MSLVLLPLSAVEATPSKGAQRAAYFNPVFGRDFPDPMVQRAGRSYYAYGTQSGPTTRGVFPILRSRDLIHWKRAGYAFRRPPGFAHARWWAPSTVRWRGRYYLFYSGSNWQTPNYGVDYAVADRVTGPYTGQGAEARVLKGIPGKVRGPGHHSIVTGPDGKTDYFVYHAWDAGMKVRQMCIDRLLWTPTGPRLDGPSYTPRPRPPLS